MSVSSGDDALPLDCWNSMRISPLCTSSMPLSSGTSLLPMATEVIVRLPPLTTAVMSGML
jgi:hypothetical protein